VEKGKKGRDGRDLFRSLGINEGLDPESFKAASKKRVEK